MAKRGIRLDLVFWGKYNAFSAASFFWFGKISYAIVPAHFLGNFNVFSAAMFSLVFRGVLSFWARC